MTSGMGSSIVSPLLRLPSSPRPYSPPDVPATPPFDDFSLLSQLELFANFPLPASFLRDLPLPSWPDLGHPFLSSYSPLVLANLCLLSHGEAIGLPSPIYSLRLRLFELVASTSSFPSDPLRAFYPWLSHMRAEVSRRRGLDLVSSDLLRSHDWRVGSLCPDPEFSGFFDACPPASRRGRSSLRRRSVSVLQDTSPYVPLSPPSPRGRSFSRSRSRSPSLSRSSSPGCFLSGHLMSTMSRSPSPSYTEYHLSLDLHGRLVSAPPQSFCFSSGSDSDVQAIYSPIRAVEELD